MENKPIKKAPIRLDESEHSALELYKNNIEHVPKLLDPFLQTVGLASLVGTSDSGKSTLLRQLSLSIALGLPEFLTYKLHTKTNKVIYVSTEEDPISISPSIKRQVKYFSDQKLFEDETMLDNLTYIFDTENLLVRLHKKLEKEKVDLIVIDAFTDVFSGEINANTQVRDFLNKYDQLAKRHRCLVIFLHHIGKRRDKGNPTKDSIIGSQAFEAKMRVVLELRPRGLDKNETDLWVLKSNFLESSYKQKSFMLKFKDGSIFENTQKRIGKNPESKVNDPDTIDTVLRLHKEGKSYRKIAEMISKVGYTISKTTVESILKNHKVKV